LQVRVRFAPSPSGYLHIGGARTALFNWLFARHHGGVFILRIEDTDRERSTDESIQAIIDSMKWLALDWDEGPYRQTERFDLYRAGIEQLLKEGKAYYCYCSQEELAQRRDEAMQKGLTPKYDRRCRDYAGPAPHQNPVVRFKAPLEGQTVVNDDIRGTVVFENSQLDDLIIARSDGTPTYNFVVVMDDVDMGITHIIRGDDHLNNTPRQIQLYQALGHELPRFAHLPMILGPDKTRLSKRHGATSVLAYRDMGYLPDALVNYLVRLGWASGDQEVFSREELVEKFSLDNVGKASAVFNPEKLQWLNSVYINQTPLETLAELVHPFLVEQGFVEDSQKQEWLCKAIATLKERTRDLKEMAGALMRYYISDTVTYEPAARKKFLNSKTLPYLKAVKAGLSELDTFDEEHMHAVFAEVVKEAGIKLGAVAQPVRVAMTGGTASPGIFDVLALIGKTRVIQRLDRAIEICAHDEL